MFFALSLARRSRRGSQTGRRNSAAKHAASGWPVARGSRSWKLPVPSSAKPRPSSSRSLASESTGRVEQKLALALPPMGVRVQRICRHQRPGFSGAKRRRARPKRRHCSAAEAPLLLHHAEGLHLPAQSQGRRLTPRRIQKRRRPRARGRERAPREGRRGKRRRQSADRRERCPADQTLSLIHISEPTRPP